MKNINEIAFIIQARLGSTRVPQKMIREFNGTSLFEICIQKLLGCSSIPKNQIYASIYENELVTIANKHSINIFNRSEISAKAESSLQEIYEWHNKLPQFKYVILVNACQPFLACQTINNFVDHFVNSNYDGLFGVIKKKNYFWNKNHDMITTWPSDQTIMNTKVVEETLEAAHSLYASRLDCIKSNVFMGSFKKNSPELFEMSEYETFDIDYEWQFQMAKDHHKSLINNL